MIYSKCWTLNPEDLIIYLTCLPVQEAWDTVEYRDLHPAYQPTQKCLLILDFAQHLLALIPLQYHFGFSVESLLNPLCVVC